MTKIKEFLEKKQQERDERFKRPFCYVDYEGYVDSEGNPLPEEEKENNVELGALETQRTKINE